MAGSPRMRYGQETYVLEQRGRYVLVGGLGAMGVGRMWMWLREDGTRAPISDPFRDPTDEEIADMENPR